MGVKPRQKYVRALVHMPYTSHYLAYAVHYMEYAIHYMEYVVRMPYTSHYLEYLLDLRIGAEGQGDVERVGKILHSGRISVYGNHF
jgi:hypothetical protein